MIMLGATPGGTTSNLFTYYSKGDVSLSISMTVASSLAAIVMMPLLVGLYVGGLETSITVPYVKIIATIVIMLIPVMIGMAVRGKSESKARTLEKVGSYTGILIIVLLIVTFVVRERAVLLSTPGTVYIGIAILCFGGFTFGYWGSRLAKLSKAMARTVSLETGIQNTPVTMAIIIASFPKESHAEMLVLPLIYAVSILGGNILSLLVYRNTHYRALGASGGVCGIIYASVFLLPGGSIYILPIPFPIPSWTYAILFLLISIYGMRSGRGNIGHVAHLGGALIGLLATFILFPRAVLAQPWLLLLIVAISAGIAASGFIKSKISPGS